MIERFIFEGNKANYGEYCLPINGDGKCYYKLLYQNNKVVGYEKYEMKTHPYSAIVQKVDENGSNIGLVTGDDSTIGSIFVKAINDKSEVLIDADKISINGTTTFADIINPGTTTISGNYIKTGTLESNNYKQEFIRFTVK